MQSKKKKEPFRQRGGIWYFRVKVPGKFGEWKWTERKGGKTKTECRENYRRLMQELEAAELAGDTINTGNIDVSQALAVWFDEYVDINTRDATRKSYHGMMEKHVIPAFGDVPLKKVNARMLQRFVNDKAGELKRSSLKKLASILKAAFSYMVNPCGFIEYNPADSIRLPRELDEPPQTVRVFTPGELKTIEEHFPPGHHYYLAIHICLYTGLRIGEALGLRWQDIDLKSGQLSVCGTMTESGVWQAMPKTKRSFRTIPFGEKLHKLLKQERKRQAGASLTFAYGTYNADGYVCVRPDSGRRVSTSDLRYFNDWCKTTFGHGSTHSLRHTHATMLLEAGESLESVSKRLGHSSIVTTSKYYSHITEKGNSQMKNTLDNLFPAKCE